ncbi:substrate-binding periplasmic protein [Saccharospirillum salsuginis]|uniref:Amino acid ABC transporter substrate-binding protein n=1 Tax=Saccharospirillum salsuginis TaxID=418750 RepID=A0A918K1J2_9GAMM|nr:transporter substrate-binding domain-containing protein [Saccharospirillum salsuginis]GGX39932.1 amino acid ABC transporter substrate-binding protein [Saccharospirillum salsuginis]
MLRIRHSLLVLLALVLGFAQADTITAAQDPWPPFVQDQAEAGLSVDLVRAALEHEGYEVEMTIMPWARAIDQVKNGNIDVLVATWYTEERTAYLRYSEPYMQNQLKFIKQAGDDFEFEGLESLSGKTVGVVRGYGYGDEFLNATNFSRPETNNIASNLLKLDAGRIDLTLEDEIVALSTMKNEGIDPSKYDFTNNALSVNDLHVSSGIANARSEEIIAAFNRGLAAIRENGTMAELLSKYGVE